MAVIITIDDLPDSLKTAESIETLLDGLNAKAVRVAPCLNPAPPGVVDAGKLAEAKLILLGVVKRWVEAGSGAIQTEQNTAGVFSRSTTIDTRQRGGWKLWPSDITDLQDLCKEITGTEGKAFVVNIGPTCDVIHQPWCSLMLGATFCSCGADLAGYPLWEGGEIS